MKFVNDIVDRLWRGGGPDESQQAAMQLDRFDEQWYLSQNFDVANAVRSGAFVSGRDHFIRFGFHEGRRGFPLPSPASAAMPAATTSAALPAAPAIVASPTTPTDDQNMRVDEFDEGWYLSRYADIAQAVAGGTFASGRDHYIRFGYSEGRNGCADQADDNNDWYQDDDIRKNIDLVAKATSEADADMGPGSPRTAAVRTCFIHAGGHKTGSSALQLFLARNRNELYARGYFVPRTGMWHSSLHRAFVHGLSGEGSKDDQVVVKKVEEELQTYDSDHVIISAEALETMLDRVKGFSNVLDFFVSRGFDIKFLYYVRNTPQLLNSRYSQVIKTYRIDTSFGKFVAHSLRGGSISPSLGSILRTMKENKVDYIFRPYDESVRRRGIVTDFLDCIGLKDFVANEDTARTNESAGPITVEAARRSIQMFFGTARKIDHRLASACGRMLRRSVKRAEVVEPAYCGLTTESAARIEALARPENDAFAKEVWGKTWAETFKEDVGRTYVSNDLRYDDSNLEQLEQLYTVLEILIPKIKRIMGEARFRKNEDSAAAPSPAP